MIRGVVLDLDDTLLDRRQSIWNYAARFHETFAERLPTITVAQLNSAIVAADRGGYRSKAEVMAELSSVLPWQADLSAADFSEHWKTVYPLCCVPSDGMATTLADLKLRGLKIGLITNGSAHAQRAKITRLELGEWLDSVVISDEVKLRKPDRRIFEFAQKQLGLEPAELVFVGDHPINDVVGANEAGWTAIWLRGKHEWPGDRELPSLQIESLAMLKSILGKLA